MSSLLGYSVTSGTYCSKETLYALSSPAGQDLTGIILIVNPSKFTPAKKQRDDNYHCVWKTITDEETRTQIACDDRDVNWNSEIRLTGPDFGSYFGSVLESIDMNGDQVNFIKFFILKWA